MKKVAGSLRLDLAQYRELEAFTKFGSDLDKATLQQLRRGSRLVEILKQGQFIPYPVEDQVVLIFAGTYGYLDEIPISGIPGYMNELLETMKLKHQDIMTEIAAKKELPEDIIKRLKDVLDNFTGNFKVSIKA